jgi:outer membrane protein insertion porin family
LGAAVLALSAAASALAGEPGREGGAPEIVKVEVNGSITLTPEAMRHALATRVGRPYDPAVLDNDLHGLMKTGRYRAVRWSQPRREAGGVALTLTVEERPILKEIEYVAVSDAELVSLEARSARDERVRSGIERKVHELLKQRGRSPDGKSADPRASGPGQIAARSGAPGGRPGGPQDAHIRRTALVSYYLSVYRTEKPKSISLDPLKDEAKKVGLFAGPRERHDEALAFRLARRIEDLYREKSFFHARVDYVARPLEGKSAQGLPQVKLVFAISEGQKTPVRGCRFVGNRVYEDRKLWGFLKKLLARSGGAKGFDRLRFERALWVVQGELYHSRGYLDAKMELKYLELFTYDPPYAAKRQWLVPRVEIDEGELYTVGEMKLKVEPPDAPEGTEEPLEVGPEEIMSAIREPTDEHRNEPALKEGGVFSDRSLALAAMRVQSLLGRYGRINSSVKGRRILPEKGTTIPVGFVVKPSRRYRVGGVRVRGNYKTKPSVFIRELTQAGVKPTLVNRKTDEVFREGSILDSRSLKLAERNIKFTGLVKNEHDQTTNELIRPAVKIHTFPRDDGMAEISVDVNENETGMLQMGLSIDSNGETAGMIEFSQRNFNILGWPRSLTDWSNAFSGAGQTLGLSWSFGEISKNFNVKFEEPYFLGWPVRLGVNYFDREHSYSEFDDAREGVRATLGRSWSLHNYKRRRLALWASLGDERAEIDVEDPLTADPKYLAEEGSTRLRRGGLNISYDSRDSFLLPSTGWYAKVAHEVVGGTFGGDKDFDETTFDFRRHFRLGATLTDQPYVLQFRVRVHQAEAGDTDVPFYEKYYAGGFGSLRGFDFRSVGPKDAWGRAIGGDFKLLETVEFTFPLSADASLRGSFFYDAGNVWSSRSDFDFSDQKQSAGVGILIQPPGWPVPISIYLGWVLNEEPEDVEQHVSFMLGTMFF